MELCWSIEIKEEFMSERDKLFGNLRVLMLQSLIYDWKESFVIGRESETLSVSAFNKKNKNGREKGTKISENKQRKASPLVVSGRSFTHNFTFSREKHTRENFLFPLLKQNGT
jgi:hypothetical protein